MSGPPRTGGPPIIPTKQVLRAQGRRLRRAMSAEERRSASERAALHLSAHDALGRARTIALYAALEDEADPSALEVVPGKRIVYPRVDGDALGFREARLYELAAGYRGIREPDARLAMVPIAEIDVIVVPGTAFTPDGWRVGSGRGYYDRLLAGARSSLAVGFAFACQLVPEIPIEPHDQRLDAVVTEDGFCSPGSDGAGIIRGR